jgi:hypothetical protein
MRRAKVRPPAAGFFPVGQRVAGSLPERWPTRSRGSHEVGSRPSTRATRGGGSLVAAPFKSTAKWTPITCAPSRDGCYGRHRRSTRQTSTDRCTTRPWAGFRAALRGNNFTGWGRPRRGQGSQRVESATHTPQARGAAGVFARLRTWSGFEWKTICIVLRCAKRCSSLWLCRMLTISAGDHAH